MTRTSHPEWYGHAPVTHPAIAQNTFECFRCGSLVVDLSAHDVLHETIDAFVEEREARQSAVHPDRITEPAIDVPARTGRTRATSSRGSSAGPQSAS